MGQVTKLIDVIAALESLDQDATIYVAEPWSSESPAVVEVEPPSGGLPQVAAQEGLKYFLEVFVARDFLADWKLERDRLPSVQERCERLIRYAVNDA
jgi:hypothetical protein